MMGPTIEVFTLCMGGELREMYLRTFLSSLQPAIREFSGQVVTRVFFQGTPPSNLLDNLLRSLTVKCTVWPENKGRALGQEFALAECGECDIILRTDDDARILESDFLYRLVEIHSLVPDAFVHAFPVGLTGNVGGTHGRGPRLVLEHPFGGGLYTFRKVSRMGGLARAAAPATWEKIPWRCDIGKDAAPIESIQLSQACAEQNIPQYYLENRWIVEHQDSTDGQKWRKDQRSNP